MSGSIEDHIHRVIADPYLHIVLYQPEIPFNTGNIARLCGAAQLRLHLVHPLGFQTDDKHLKRAGLDYWSEVDIRQHQDFQAFLEHMEEGRSLIALSRHADLPYTQASVNHGDYLLFGQETRGLPRDIRGRYPCHAIPMWGRVRSLNLSTAVGIVSYHYLHEMGRF